MSAAQSLVETFVHPASAMSRVAEQRRFVPALAAATLVAIVFALAAVPRLDFRSAAAVKVDRSPDAAQMTPHQREEALAAAGKLGAVAGYAGAVFGPGLAALLSGFALWLGFKVAGGRPDFRAALAVASFALLPGALRSLLALPAVLRLESIPPPELSRLLPSSPGALLPPGASGPLASFLYSLDAFSLWAVALAALGMARAAQVSRLRAAATTAVLWLAWVALFEVALPSLRGVW